MRPGAADPSLRTQCRRTRRCRGKAEVGVQRNGETSAPAGQRRGDAGWPLPCRARDGWSPGSWRRGRVRPRTRWAGSRRPAPRSASVSSQLPCHIGDGRRPRMVCLRSRSTPRRAASAQTARGGEGCAPSAARRMLQPRRGQDARRRIARSGSIEEVGVVAGLATYNAMAPSAVRGPADQERLAIAILPVDELTVRDPPPRRASRLAMPEAPDPFGRERMPASASLSGDHCLSSVRRNPGLRTRSSDCRGFPGHVAEPLGHREDADAVTGGSRVIASKTMQSDRRSFERTATSRLHVGAVKLVPMRCTDCQCPAEVR